MPQTFSSTINDVANFIKATNGSPTSGTIVVGYMTSDRVLTRKTYYVGTPSQFENGVRHPLRMSADLLSMFVSGTTGLAANPGARHAWGLFDTALRSYAAECGAFNAAYPRTWSASADLSFLPASLVGKWRTLCDAYAKAWLFANTLAVEVVTSQINMPGYPGAPVPLPTSPTASSLGIPDITGMNPANTANIMSAQRSSEPVTPIGPGTIDTSPASANTIAAGPPIASLSAGSSPTLQFVSGPALPTVRPEPSIMDHEWFWPLTIGGGALVLVLLFRPKKGA